MSNAAIPRSVSDLLDDFSECFTRPGLENFRIMILGWLVCAGRHSICRVFQAAGDTVANKHHSTLYRFLSHGRWCADAVGKVLFGKLIRFSPGPIRIAIDDTLCHKGGPHIFGAAMHYDAHASSYGRGSAAGPTKSFIFGHNWVVISLWIPLPWDQARGLAIPFLFRLYRSKKHCPKNKYRKRTVIADEMIKLVANWLPQDRELYVLGDSEYACKAIVRELPANTYFTGPMCMDAALYKPAPVKYSGKGRPRVKGDRLPSPEKMAKSRSSWEMITLTIYGKEISLQIKTVRCLWHTVAGPKPVRVVVTRDPNARFEDRAYFSTIDESDESSVAEQKAVVAVLIEYARRWEIEVAFRNTKQAMGLEDPQNGWWRRPSRSRKPKKRPGPNAQEKVGETAVHHTLACVFVAYAITVLWYLEHGQVEDDVARARREAPWYRHKCRPSFIDMLAAIRREIWVARLSQHPLLKLGREKVDEILPGWLLAA